MDYAEEEDRSQAWEYWHTRALDAEANAYRLRAILREIIELDHHNHAPESKATEIARAALTASEGKK